MLGSLETDSSLTRLALVRHCDALSPEATIAAYNHMSYYGIEVLPYLSSPRLLALACT